MSARLLPLLIIVSLVGAGTARAADTDSTVVAAAADTPAAAAVTGNGLIYLVPEMATDGYHISDDRERFRNRVSFSPAYGQLGNNDLFLFRASYSPNTWLAYEVALEHNPASSLHAMLHTFSVQLRYPLRGRVQPYGSLGYGMMTVYPGQAINADPVTKNALAYGGGMEFYIRNDVALRGELRGTTVLGQQLGTDGTVAYDYREYSIGFAFYRSLGD
jgi:hypothetical protein